MQDEYNNGILLKKKECRQQATAKKANQMFAFQKIQTAKKTKYRAKIRKIIIVGLSWVLRKNCILCILLYFFKYNGQMSVLSVLETFWLIITVNGQTKGDIPRF
jgi:hypothetical protein